MLARRLTTILPAMSLAEALETTRIHSVAGLTGARTALVTRRPFRAPHHTIADVGLIGGGQGPRPDDGGSSRPHALHPTLDGPEISAQLLGDLLHR
jgi:predicted ATPase with chaperone activity